MKRALHWLRMAAGCMAASVAFGAVASDEIVVGQVAPLSGVLASTGKEMVLGVKVYFDHVNAQGGVNGRKIRHVVKDDGYKVASAGNDDAPPKASKPAKEPVAAKEEPKETKKASSKSSSKGTDDADKVLRAAMGATENTL